MCRLLGIVANQPVDLEFSLERFKDFARDNPDGWWIGWYENGVPRIYKQGISALADKSTLSRISREVRSKIIIVHVREGTGAVSAQRNSHPFSYQSWLFAHNGSVDRNHLFSLLSEEYKRAVNGETDSEIYFYWILQNIFKYGNIIFAIDNALKQIIPKPHTGLNFLLSDGRRLYAFLYSKKSESYYSLYKLERKSEDAAPIELCSSKTSVVLRNKSKKTEKAVLICSEKLTRENWQEIGVGHLLMIG